MTLDDFTPYIAPRAKGCPDATIKFNVRLAVIELCQKALLWREYQTSVPTVALQTAYAYAPVAGQQIVRLLSAQLAGEDVPLVDPRVGKARDDAGYLSNYIYGSLAGFELRPAQVAALSIITYAAVAPTFAATTVSDTFSRYMEHIAHGALSRVLADKDKTWSDMAGATMHKSQWVDAIESAKTDAFNGFARVTQRTAKVWF